MLTNELYHLLSDDSESTIGSVEDYLNSGKQLMAELDLSSLSEDPILCSDDCNILVQESGDKVLLDLDSFKQTDNRRRGDQSVNL